MSTLDRALEHARNGFRVFPIISNSKQPLIPDHLDRATTDEQIIRTWWGNQIQEPNIGIATGDHLIVIDVDNKNGKNGGANLKALADEHGGIPQTRIATTPSGGVHLYFQTSEQFGSGASRIAEAVDHRGNGGYVVAPGSSIDGRTYEWHNDAAPAQIPAWLAARLNRHVEIPRSTAAPAVLELDTAPAIEQATHWLTAHATPSIQGAGGNDHAYTVAARLRDFGISEQTAVDLLLAHWNDTCSPPWSVDEILTIASNAFRFAKFQAGNASIARFTPVTGGFALTPVFPLEEAQIPRRQWVIYGFAAIGYLTVVVAPPGAGKTTFILQLLASAATGRGEIAGVKVVMRCAAALWNNEDDLEEMRRRLLAIRKQFKIDWRELSIEGRPALYLDSGSVRRLVVAARVDGKVSIRGVDELVTAVIAAGVKLVAIDPFVETHELDENDNVEMAMVARIFADIARRAGCAVVLVHHTRKLPSGSSDSHAGNLDSGRGASSLMGVARFAFTLYGLSQKDAKRWGVAEEERHLFVRLDGAKANLALVTGKPTMLKRLSVDVNGESVGVLAPVDLRERFVSSEDAAMLRDIVSIVAASTAEVPTYARETLGAEHCAQMRLVTAALKALPMYGEIDQGVLSRRVRAAIGDDGTSIDGWHVGRWRDERNDKSKSIVYLRKSDNSDNEAENDGENNSGEIDIFD